MAGQGAQRGGSISDAEDRRDFPRVPMRFLVRSLDRGGDFEPREGDLSVGGFSCVGAALSDVESVEVRFSLPGLPEALQARGQVVRLSEGPQGRTAHVAFVNPPLALELAVARHLEGLPPAGARSP
ncbi:PilZ domain-containing protein [Aggregicoccus sp. 17bor-14]|uniref:PilZ domain-containing protein n=1 Tax=Myxococcaceae TaxID=31 RepID=UPI00129CF223|nr:MULTISPECIES: PilZ domain-containing protein [Myxococcaceae]MBF5044313.1 PilZ domain-containing protein [Simulacricoccus sp. 17bor-14]MRI90062.1 PilZ domain-containing protein [Aggregicoccus sp. 17bor-14]